VGAPAELVSFCAKSGCRIADEDGFARRREFDERALVIGGHYCMVGVKTAMNKATPAIAHRSGYREMPETAPLAVLRVESHLYAGRESTQIDCGSFQPSLVTFQVMDGEDWLSFVGIAVVTALVLWSGVYLCGMGAALGL
jgi:hypothetical protein